MKTAQFQHLVCEKKTAARTGTSTTIVQVGRFAQLHQFVRDRNVHSVDIHLSSHETIINDRERERERESE